MAEAVAEEGFARTSIADVTARAGVSTKTFYEHFESKEDCFLAAHAACVDGLGGIVRQALGSSRAEPGARFSRMVEAYLDTLASEPALARTFLIEVYAAGPRALERRAAAQTRFAERIRKAFGLPSSARFDCEAVVGAISSLVTTKVSLDAYDELADLHEPIVRFAERQLAIDARGERRRA